MTDLNSPKSARRVNVAVVGLGFMGVTHLQAYLKIPNARVAAVCSRTRLPVNGVLPGVAGNIKQTENINLGPDVGIFRQFEELLTQPDIDVVDICTPTPLHTQQVVAALRAGKNVICEKPLARTSTEAREILSVANNSTGMGMVMPAMCMRFWPGWSQLKQIIAHKAYGKVLAARFRRVSEMPVWSKAGTYGGNTDLGGALFDLHIHDTDFVNYLFGRPAGVFSTGVTDSSGVINHVVTQYHYPDGPAVYAEGSWLLAGGFNMAYTLFYERATVDYDLARGSHAMVITESGQQPRVIETPGPDGYGVELEYFVQCVVERRSPKIVTLPDGIAALEICEAEERSVRAGIPVKI
jgi:predicted dehydrogenase